MTGRSMTTPLGSSTGSLISVSIRGSGEAKTYSEWCTGNNRSWYTMIIREKQDLVNAHALYTQKF